MSSRLPKQIEASLPKVKPDEKCPLCKTACRCAEACRCGEDCTCESCPGAQAAEAHFRKRERANARPAQWRS